MAWARPAHQMSPHVLRGLFLSIADRDATVRIHSNLFVISLANERGGLSQRLAVINHVAMSIPLLPGHRLFVSLG